MQMNATSRLPSKPARHKVVGHLATGGMAEVLLGRVVGPSGFERPVVLKRILPHLARQEAFVRMFLDEARIIARIRHPNVVQVQDLVQDDGEVSMVMEYLEGENVSGIVRRLLARNEILPPSLAAHIVAEACAGLHAAHELADDDGRSLGIVHRDVSPQNLFVTYDGAVKVIDFGVAIAHDRTARTETGQLKGKLDYMAPEHVAGKELDRRADIFALGVVLYELVSGRRLFKRANALATMKAITAEPIVPPSRLSKTCPPALERIAMRALKRAPDERHATAAEMRRELVAALRELDPEGGAEEALASLMQRVFADRK